MTTPDHCPTPSVFSPRSSAPAASPTFLLADSQDLTRDSVKAYLQSLGFSNIVEADNKGALQAFLHSYRDVCLIIDPLTVELFDFPAFQQLMRRYPELPVIILTTNPTVEYIQALRDFPLVGMALKTNTREEIISAIRCMVRRERYLSHEITSRLLSVSQEESRGRALTFTETEIIRLIAQGFTVKDIATIRHCSAHTINTHKKNIYHKLHINSAYEATRYAQRAGLSEPVEYYI